MASPYAPRCTNVTDGELVFNRLLIVTGHAGPDNDQEGTLLVHLPTDGFAPQKLVYEVNHAHFKALIPLVQGQNLLTLTYIPGRWQTPQEAESEAEVWGGGESTTIKVRYEESDSPPLHLAVLLAKDSPAAGPTAGVFAHGASTGTASPSSVYVESRGNGPFSKMASLVRSGTGVKGPGKVADVQRAIVDAPPGPRMEMLRRGGLEEVKRRFVIQAYLWQGCHAEQMRRHNLGRRSFRLDDMDSVIRRKPGAPLLLEDMPKVHVLRSQKTMAQFLDADHAQQHKGASKPGILFDYAREAIQEHIRVGHRELAGQAVCVLIVDSRWDAKSNLLRGHAALGGGGGPGETTHCVMGSHWLWAAPSGLSGVTGSFLDMERTDTRFCVNDLDEGPTAWQTLNTGSGSMMHEVGHALDQPHWPTGIMARGCHQFNRAFMTREAQNVRLGWGEIKPIAPQNDSDFWHVHRAQAIRARWHPAFHLPTDPFLPYLSSGDPLVWRAWKAAHPSWQSGILAGSGPSVHSDVGLALLEFYAEPRPGQSGASRFITHVEWTGLHGKVPPKYVSLPVDYVKSLVNFDSTSSDSPRIKVVAVGCNMHKAELDDYAELGFLQPTLALEGLNMGSKPVFKGRMTRLDQDRGHQHWEQLFRSEWDVPDKPYMTAVHLYGGHAFYGLEMEYSDGSRQTFGRPQGKAAHVLPTAGPQDGVERLVVRCGAWVDALQVVLRSGRSSILVGKNDGGHEETFAPPPGYLVVGLRGSHGQWCDSIGLLMREI